MKSSGSSLFVRTGVLAAAVLFAYLLPYTARAADPARSGSGAVPVSAEPIEIPSEEELPAAAEQIEVQVRRMPVKERNPARQIFSGLKNSASKAINRAAGNIFAISKISIDGEYYRSEAEILETIDPENGGQGLTFSNLARSGGLGRLSRDPWFNSVKHDWSLFPLTLSITVSEEQPWIVAEYAGEPWLVSRAGILLQPTRTIANPKLALLASTLPRLDGVDPPVESDSNLASASTRLSYAAKMLRLISASGELPFAAERFTLDLDGNLMIQPMDIANDPVIVFGPADFNAMTTRLKELAAVTRDLRKRGEHPKKIDLRFQDQIIIE